MHKTKTINILYIIVLIIGLTPVFYFSTNNYHKKNTNKSIENQEIDTNIYEYGIVANNYVVYKSKIKRNENLASILLPYHVSYEIIEKIAQNDSIFNVKHIKSGQPYTILCTNDSLHKAAYFIYEKSKTNYTVFDFTDSINIYNDQKEVDIKIKCASGIIQTSLWNTIVNQGVNPNVVMELSDIYAWTIDFYGIQKNDKFKLIYESKQIDSVEIGIGKVLAAYFWHRDKANYAIYYKQDSLADYFDETANSLRRAFLKAPLKYSRISSRFSHSRLHPILKIRRPHHGVDYAAPLGTPVHTIGDGVVISKKYTRGAGNMVTIKHNGTYTTKYLHLSKFATGLIVGKTVKQGEVIGYVGSTGLSTGPHLDFRFYKNGKAVDPLTVEIPPAEPVKEQHLEAYKTIMHKMIGKLDSIAIPNI